MRGSNKGMELIIVSVVKDLAEEVGFSLTNSAVSHGCPSWQILALGDKRLASNVLVAVAEDINLDCASWIAFMVDHVK